MYIETEWLESVRKKSFYYPAAGFDFSDPISLLKDHVSEFVFCDIHYKNGLILKPVMSEAEGYKLIESNFSGDRFATLQLRHDSYGKSYRFLEPSKLIETYLYSGRQISVTRRRGFGQFGIAEFKDGEMGVFMHRGDSLGEGGSGMHFLANRKTRYEPLTNLFDQLARKFSNRAIVISDGSNSLIPDLMEHHRVSDDGKKIYEKLAESSFLSFKYRWQCVGWLTPRYGPTLVWGIERV
jgi:hypothetical protein